MSSGKSDLVDVDATLKRETEKAFLLDAGGEEPVWVPKSQVENNSDGTFTMPYWLAKDKGLI